MKNTIIVDCKNLAQFSSGISGYFKPLLRASIEYFSDYNFILLAPNEFDTYFIKDFSNWEILIVKQKKVFNKTFEIIYYDLWTYPKAIKKINACLLVSPYYDFVIPKKYKSKSIITVHDLCYWELVDSYSHKVRLYHKFLFYFNVSRVSKIITVSYSSLHKIKKNVSKSIFNKCVVVYNIFERNNININYTKEKKLKKILLYTGGFEQRKNVEMLFYALSILKNDFDFKLFFTGNFKENIILNKLINKFQLERQIILTGIVSSNKLEQYYNDCDVVLNLSLCEGFGRSNIEAMIYKKPLVCSDIDIFREICGDYPIYCDPKMTQSIIEAIKQSFDINNKLNKMINIDQFSSRKNTKIFIETIEEVINV